MDKDSKGRRDVMADPFCLLENDGGTYDIILFHGYFNTEFSMELATGELLKKMITKIPGKKVIAVRSVRMMLASGIALTIPFAQFASAAESEPAKFAMSYVYFGTVSEQIRNVTLSGEVLNTVSPAYFELNADGTLKRNYISRDFITAMHERGIKVVPFLSNGWNRQTGINALNRAEELSRSIAQTVLEYGLDGVNVDIENVTGAQRDQYTLLVKLLRESLPREKDVSVAVAANPWGTNDGWQGSYDYAGLAQYADYLMVMAYDEHYNGSEAGAVASIGFVEKTIKYALSQTDKEKIVVGIPFYGRLWSTDGSLKGEGISLKRIFELTKQYRHKTIYDEASKTPVLHITADEPFVLNGKTMKSGNYAIWYENADSIKYKLALVGKYGLKGAGNWSAGQETTGVWDYYELWLNGHYFSDILNHFAKDEIVKLTSDGIVKGMTDTLFSPDRVLTRAQAAVLFVRLMGLETSQNGGAFSDTKNHWAKAEISAAKSAGLLTGYTDGTFRPDDPITRAEMAAIIARMTELSYTEGSAPAFSDVSGHWANQEITALAALSILRGYADNTFRPQNNITRGEAAAVIERMRDYSDRF